jgi:tRNA threonylcarbamoyladenosine biosynthesis protein TsaB
MLILAFDTSSRSAAVAILQDDVVLYDVIINNGLNHSEVLLPAINQACIQTNIKISEIDLFACTIGPGSFTGLRIGASTLKGFLAADQKPAVGVSSLAALALNVGKTPKKICAVMDAGRGQVYTAYFHYKQNGFLEQISEDRVLNPSDIKQDSKKEIVIMDNGAIRYADAVTSDKKVNNVPSAQQYIRASSVGILGREKYDQNELLNPETFIPLYLRKADAQMKKPLFNN